MLCPGSESQSWKHQKLSHESATMTKVRTMTSGTLFLRSTPTRERDKESWELCLQYKESVVGLVQNSNITTPLVRHSMSALISVLRKLRQGECELRLAWST